MRERESVRDLYSEYREGTLEPRLRANVEARFAADPSLAEDYAAFDAACAGLDAFAAETVVAPDYLSARIFDRIEAAAGERSLQTPSGRFSLPGLARRLGFAALALAAVGGAALTILHRNDASGVAPAGVLPSSAPTRLSDDAGRANGNVLPNRETTVASATSGRNAPPASPDVIHPVLVDGRVFVDLQGALPHDVSILAAPDAKSPSGTLLRRFRVDGTRLHSELSNPYPDPAAFVVRMDRDADSPIIVVPGTDRSRSAATGSGDLLAFAKALARTFGTPVVLHVTAGTEKAALTPSGDSSSGNVSPGNVSAGDLPTGSDGPTNGAEGADTGNASGTAPANGEARNGATTGSPVAPPAPTTIVWNFDDPAVRSQEAQAHALHALEGRGFSVDVMPGGLLSITGR